MAMTVINLHHPYVNIRADAVLRSDGRWEFPDGVSVPESYLSPEIQMRILRSRKNLRGKVGFWLMNLGARMAGHTYRITDIQ